MSVTDADVAHLYVVSDDTFVQTERIVAMDADCDRRRAVHGRRPLLALAFLFLPSTLSSSVNDISNLEPFRCFEIIRQN
jgi:hypothetical protein